MLEVDRMDRKRKVGQSITGWDEDKPQAIEAKVSQRRGRTVSKELLEEHDRWLNKRPQS